MCRIHFRTYDLRKECFACKQEFRRRSLSRRREREEKQDQGDQEVSEKSKKNRNGGGKGGNKAK